MLETRPLHPNLGAAVLGCDLSQPLDEETCAQLRTLLPEHGVLCFPEQHLSPDDQIRFMEVFCAIRPHHGVETAVADAPRIAVLSNITENGKPIGFQHKLGVEWHTDGSGWRQCTVATSLYAVEVPKQGGDTLFVSGYAAYEALDPALREQADQMRIVYSRRQLIEKLAKASGTHQPMSPEEQARFPDVVRPLVSPHPVTGRRAATLSIEEAWSLEGLALEESEPHLHAMLAALTTDAQVYRHRWQVGELLIWDNRCMMHSPTEYTYADDRRLMQRVIGWDPDPGLEVEVYAASVV